MATRPDLNLDMLECRRVWLNLANRRRADDGGAMTAASHRTPAEIAELLAFYASAGVDDALEDAPINRFAEAAARPVGREPAERRPAERAPAAPRREAAPESRTVPEQAPERVENPPAPARVSPC